LSNACSSSYKIRRKDGNIDQKNYNQTLEITGNMEKWDQWEKQALELLLHRGSVYKWSFIFPNRSQRNGKA
jgi:hypothetical protein